MATPAELAAEYTDLDADELEHLQRLLGSWSVLADLSFSDLVLLVPVTRSEEPKLSLVVLGQMRPNNRPTLVEQDLVGQTYDEEQWSLPVRTYLEETVLTDRVHHPVLGEPVPVECVPVRFGAKVIGVLLRVSLGPLRGPTSLYEKTYLDLFDRLAAMVAESAFPFPEEDVGTEESPRVGDGVVVVDAEGRVEFASPNALNAFHRMGVYSPPEGRRFSDLGVEESAAEWALATGRPVVEEVERRPDVIVLLHCIPLLSHGVVTGAMILLRDVTDVRRLDRLLLSKDAAIREVHHRVKNNLQTISSLLSLQARRVDEGAARVALREAERRVRSIALVHEILSREPGDQVPFDDIITSLIQMAEDSVVSGQTIEITVQGDLGDVSAEVATPLAVILAEVLQNAVEHAFEPDGGPTDVIGHVSVALVHTGGGLQVEVRDDGRGLPEGFSIRETRSLGLSIVRDLVVSQLGGSIDMATVAEAEGGGTRVVIETPDRVARN
jgi:two-component sensor histidine kinase